MQRVVVNYFYFLHTLQNLSKFEIKQVKDNSLLSDVKWFVTVFIKNIIVFLQRIGVMRRYETSIKELMIARNNYEQTSKEAPVFLSNWDSDFESIKMPALDFNDLTNRAIQKYYFWTDEENYKTNIIEYFKKTFSNDILPESFTIASNGTSSLMVTMYALKEKGVQKVLIFTPMYFSILNLLDEMDFEVVEYNLSYENSFEIDFENLERVIQTNNIEAIIINNPIFGTGIELKIDEIKNIASISNKYNIWFLMDYIYGGLLWNIDNKHNYIFNYPIYEAVRLANKHIFIESISKRIFFNGIKIALIFSQPDFMRRILRLSIFMVGSMALHQVEITKKIYSVENQDQIIQKIQETAEESKRKFELLKSVLKDSPCILSESMSGYFSLITIPKAEKENDLIFAQNILKRKGVLTIPHSRYLLRTPASYSFRINLLINKNELITGITKIKNLE